MNVSQNPALQSIICAYNQLSNLDVTADAGLSQFWCENNQLSALDVSQNTALGSFWCSNNQLTTLDITQNTNLFEIACEKNKLSNLNVSNNTNLRYFYCQKNQLTDLDVSQNTALIELKCNDNQLTSLNVKNGNNTAIIDFDARNNPDLNCIQVDDPAYSTANWTDIDPQTHFNLDCAQTYVPDDNFENYLETHNANGNQVAIGDANSMGNGIANDNYVTTAKINTVTTLYIDNQNITDLTGIEDFAALTALNCYQNQLTALDVSQNTALTSLWCSNNQLNALNLGNNASLTKLWCYDNQLSTLDVTPNTGIYWLDAANNQLTALDVSNMGSLSILSCHHNQLSDLDVSQNTALTKLWCNDNQLTGLNVKNGNNTAIVNFDATNNPDLTCIQVDNATYSATNWTNVDATASFSEDCSAVYYNLTLNTNGNGNVSLSPSGGSYLAGTTVTITATPDTGWEFAAWSGDLSGSTNPATITMNADKTVTATFNQLAQTYVPDDNFEAYLEANGMGNGIANDDYVTTANIENVTLLDVHSRHIADLTGIEDFVSLTQLRCYNNQLTGVDLSHNTQLTRLQINGNSLTALDVSQNTQLTLIDIGYNQIANIDLSHNTLLETLSASRNNLTNLDLSMLPVFVSLDVSQNHLTSLDVRNGNNSNFTRFIATSNPNLTCIFVDDPAWSDTNWTNIDATSHFVANQTECDNVGIDDATLKSVLKVYPNPVSNELYLQSKNRKNLILNLYNLIGQKLISSKTNTGYLMLNTSILPAATYVVKITIGGQSVFYNIVKK